MPGEKTETAYLSVTTSLQEQSEVVVVGRREVDQLGGIAQLTVKTRGDHRGQVLVMKTDHHAAVPHQLVKVFLRRMSVF